VRDRQRSRVYRWEKRHVAPRDTTLLPYQSVQGIVNALWSDQGLHYPPAVEPLPRQSRRTLACANRLSVFLPQQTPSWCLLHELAHAMTTTADGHSDGHGEIFMGVYLQLLVRYLRFDQHELVRSLRDHGIGIFVDARPLFLDP
jgi:hypothetical protein